MTKEIEQKISNILETEFTVLKKGEPAWDVLVINDIAHFMKAIKTLVEEVEKEAKKVNTREIIFKAIRSYIHYSYIDWQSRTGAHPGTADYINGFIDQVSKFPDSNINKLLED